MEEKEYQRVAALQDVPDGGTLAVSVGGRTIVLVRRGDTVSAMDDQCPHAGAPLSEGFVDGPTITCAWHGFSFELETGESADDTGLSVSASVADRL